MRKAELPSYFYFRLILLPSYEVMDYDFIRCAVYTAHLKIGQFGTHISNKGIISVYFKDLTIFESVHHEKHEALFVHIN